MISGLFFESNFCKSPVLWSDKAAITLLAENFFENYWNDGIDSRLSLVKPQNHKIRHFFQISGMQLSAWDFEGVAGFKEHKRSEE